MREGGIDFLEQPGAEVKKTAALLPFLSVF
jgi:hypothetical protein